MKTSFKAIAICNIFLIAFNPPSHNIIGRWIAYGSDGYETFANFNKDGSFNHTTNKGEIIQKGNYKTNSDTIYISDSGCNINYWGKYHLNFYGEDSISFSVITDTCIGREQYADGGTLKRIK